VQFPARVHSRRFTTATLVGAVAIAVGLSFASSASAETPTNHAKSATVVQVVTRGSFGMILATSGKESSLYVDTAPPCTGGCLKVWPPLLMPKGSKTPKGAADLGTAKMGQRLQVTYKGERLYTFTGDSGHSVNGNGVAGFMVAEYTG
jgi:predicted lipoprotein with Yx(FWY)xxD motif